LFVAFRARFNLSTLFDIFIDDLVDCINACSRHGIVEDEPMLARNLLYLDDAMLSLLVCESLLDYIHTWLNKWRCGGAEQVMVFSIPGESAAMPAQDRLNALDTRRHRHWPVALQLPWAV
jgi:hypothetical protein